LTTTGMSPAGPQKARKRALNENFVAQGGIAPKQRTPTAGSTSNRCNKLKAHSAKCQKMNRRPQGAQPLQDVNLSEGWAPPGKQQNTKPLQDVNLSEGCVQWNYF
jgi:hypothetical protein